MTTRTPFSQLTPEQIAFYRDNGYLVLDCLTTGEEIARMRAAYDDIFARKAGREEGLQFDLAGNEENGTDSLPQILEPLKRHKDLQNTLFEKNALAVARQLLGPRADIMGSHAIFKPSGGPPTPWHQDIAYWDVTHDHNAVSVWMPLQEATVENGCMWFVPGSHKGAILRHGHINDDPRIEGLRLLPGEADISGTVACPLSAGGATFHDGRTLHFTGANRSKTDRRALAVIFETPSVPLAVPRDFPWLREKQTARMARKAAFNERGA